MIFEKMKELDYLLPYIYFDTFGPHCVLPLYQTDEGKKIIVVIINCLSYFLFLMYYSLFNN
jgi:hypothetical protein